MKKNLVFMILLMFLSSNLMAYSNEEIALSLKRQAKIHNVDKKILYTIAKIESNFNPFVIAFTSFDKNVNVPNVQKRVLKYKDKYLIQMLGDKESLVMATRILVKAGFLVDVGLMQVNSQNFNNNEIERMFELDYNINKAVTILKSCGLKMQTFSKTIECYNKGLNFRTLTYFQRFKQNFYRDFGVRI